MTRIFESKGFILRVTSRSCFHSFTQQYVFINQDSVRQVLYKEKNGDFDELPKQAVTYIISKKKFDAIRKLCFRGLEIGIGLCTTRNSFSLSDGKSSTCFADARCADNDDIMQAISNLVGLKSGR